MEAAYLAQNKREYEITKSISLLLLDPFALISLKLTGTCVISLSEAYFDMDYPGHTGCGFGFSSGSGPSHNSAKRKGTEHSCIISDLPF